MKDKINKFFECIKREDEYKYFLFKKFYIKPDSVLTKNKEDIEKENFYDDNILSNYENLKFINMLEIVLYDNDFLDKISYYNLRSLNVFLNNFKNKSNDVNSLLDRVIRLTNINTRIKYTKEIKVYDLKDEIYNQIENDKYDNYSAFLYFNRYNTDKVIDTLICDNRFLDIIENKLLNISMDEYTISNIINILLSSIRIKTNNPESINETFTRDKLIKREYYKIYDVKRAKELVDRLNEKIIDIKAKRKIIEFHY